MGESQYTSRELSQADEALDLIDGLAKRIVAMVDEVTRHPSIEVSAVAWERFKGELEDSLSDLFNDDREHLMEISGWRPYPKSLATKTNAVLAELFQNIANNPFLKG
jgi:hypothetical protein